MEETMIVFIVGTARSGSCWLGRILAAHPEIHGSVEEEPRFSRVIEAAIYPEQRDFLLPVLAMHYYALELQHGIVSEKAHPALWIAEELAARLPTARFLVIERGPLAVVSSMLKHPDVRFRCESEWRSYPEPCPFLGLRTRAAYGQLSIAERCAARWRSHHDEVTRLVPILRDRMRVIRYEGLNRKPEMTLAAVQEWLGLDAEFEVVE